MITFKLNGEDVQGKEGEYVLQVAERYGVIILFGKGWKLKPNLKQFLKFAN